MVLGFHKVLDSHLIYSPDDLAPVLTDQKGHSIRFTCTNQRLIEVDVTVHLVLSVTTSQHYHDCPKKAKDSSALTA